MGYFDNIGQQAKVTEEITTAVFSSVFEPIRQELAKYGLEICGGEHVHRFKPPFDIYERFNHVVNENYILQNQVRSLEERLGKVEMDFAALKQLLETPRLDANTTYNYKVDTCSK